MTAAQVSDCICELFTTGHPKELSKTLHRDATVLSLADSSVLVSSSALQSHFATCKGWKSSPALRLYLETDRPGVPSYAADWFAPGTAPGFSPTGTAATPSASGVVVVYSAQRGVVRRVWVGASTVAASAATTQVDVEGSAEYEQIMDALVRPGELVGGTVSRHFNNYFNIVTIG